MRLERFLQLLFRGSPQVLAQSVQGGHRLKPVPPFPGSCWPLLRRPLASAAISRRDSWLPVHHLLQVVDIKDSNAGRTLTLS